MKKPLLLFCLLLLAALCGCNEGRNLLIEKSDLRAPPAAA